MFAGREVVRAAVVVVIGDLRPCGEVMLSSEGRTARAELIAANDYEVVTAPARSAQRPLAPVATIGLATAPTPSTRASTTSPGPR
jgi:hypothetical protein